MYFVNFPTINYNGLTVKDLTKRIIIRKSIKNNDELYFSYSLEDNELPEHVANDYYGDSNKHWIILMMNDVVDPFYDWLLSSDEIIEFCVLKYGLPTVDITGSYNVDGYNTVHHWSFDGVDYYPSPFVVSGPPNSTITTMLEFEQEENEKKRIIKVLYPEYVSNIENELLLTINGK